MLLPKLVSDKVGCTCFSFCFSITVLVVWLHSKRMHDCVLEQVGALLFVLQYIETQRWVLKRHKHQSFWQLLLLNLGEHRSLILRTHLEPFREFQFEHLFQNPCPFSLWKLSNLQNMCGIYPRVLLRLIIGPSRVTNSNTGTFEYVAE